MSVNFSDLLTSGRLRLRNPANGVTFTAFLRERQGFLGLRVKPDQRTAGTHNTFAKARVVNRSFVENWLGTLELALSDGQDGNPKTF